MNADFESDSRCSAKRLSGKYASSTRRNLPISLEFGGNDITTSLTSTMDLDTTNTINATNTIVVDGSPLSLSSVAKVSNDALSVVVSDGIELKTRLADSVEAVAKAVENGEQIYGVTTGFGGMANEKVPCELAVGLQRNLLEFLATGAGEPLESRLVRGAMLLRANVLLQGYSGIRFEVIRRLVTFLQSAYTPIVRSLGSIGASGDLVPLAAIARAITGQSDFSKVAVEDEILPGSTALARLGLEPIELLPKEGLALVNGTSFSASIAANAMYEAKRLFAASIGVQSLLLRALLAQSEPFDAFVHDRKPHPGQMWAARIFKQLIRGENENDGFRIAGSAVQDRYSVRCLPQYFGPLVEGFARIQNVVETEMNSVSDNPLVDPAGGRFYQSGNFLGQQLSMAMDDLRRYIGLLAKHLDLQIASLVTTEFSGLPPSLRGNDDLPYNMGLKGLQITGNSIMPLLTFQGNSLVDHFPVHAEQFNQNINGLSFGAANIAWNSVELFRQYVAVSMIFAVQALDLRANQIQGHFDGAMLLGANAKAIYDSIIRALDVNANRNRPFLFNDSDRWLEQDIETLVKQLSQDSELVLATAPILDSLDREFDLNP